MRWSLRNGFTALVKQELFHVRLRLRSLFSIAISATSSKLLSLGVCCPYLADFLLIIIQDSDWFSVTTSWHCLWRLFRVESLVLRFDSSDLFRWLFWDHILVNLLVLRNLDFAFLLVLWWRNLLPLTLNETLNVDQGATRNVRERYVSPILQLVPILRIAHNVIVQIFKRKWPYTGQVDQLSPHQVGHPRNLWSQLAHLLIVFRREGNFSTASQSKLKKLRHDQIFTLQNFKGHEVGQKLAIFLEWGKDDLAHEFLRERLYQQFDSIFGRKLTIEQLKFFVVDHDRIRFLPQSVRLLQSLIEHVEEPAQTVLIHIVYLVKVGESKVEIGSSDGHRGVF